MSGPEERISASTSSGHSHGSTHDTNSSNSTGNTNSQGSQSSDARSMSIKDWASYAIIDFDEKDYAKKQQTIGWVWAQEYPWDALIYKNTKNGELLDLPPYVQSRLFDGSCIYPPTQLSLFGFDFTSKAVWHVVTTGKDANINFNHTYSHATGTHRIDYDKTDPKKPILRVKMKNSEDKGKIESKNIDIDKLALDAITEVGSTNGAVVGFIKSKFKSPPILKIKNHETNSPEKEDDSYCIISDNNNLLIRGKGFFKPMVAKFDSTNELAKAEMNIFFKIIDTNLEYDLLLKCWKTTESGCVMTITVNKEYKIIKHIDDLETEGGDNNLISINLRNKNYASLDYHDYLKLGLNEINIAIEPIKKNIKKPESGFEIRALAIG